MKKENIKKTVVIASIVLVLAIAVPFGLKLYKKYKDSDLLVYEFAGFKFNWNSGVLKTVAEIMSGWTTADMSLRIKNFSNSKFTVNSIFIQLYTMKDELIVEQKKQLTEPFVIPANNNSVLTLTLDVKVAGVVALAKQLGEDTGGDIFSIIKNVVDSYYLKDGSFGTKVKLKGSFTAEGITFLNIPLDDVIEI